MRNKNKPWFDHKCRHAFGLKQEAHRPFGGSVVALGLTGSVCVLSSES